MGIPDKKEIRLEKVSKSIASNRQGTYANQVYSEMVQRSAPKIKEKTSPKDPITVLRGQNKGQVHEGMAHQSSQIA